MTYRELLELAAKAAGISGKYADWDDGAGIAVPYQKVSNLSAAPQSGCGTRSPQMEMRCGWR